MKNWKTTLIGVVGAVLTVMAGGGDQQSVIQAATMAALGVVAKDFDKSHTQP